MPLHSAYAASKHAVDAFLESLRVELRHDRVPVQITQIMPATINTPLFEKGKSKIGYQPWGMPPFYSPATVARAILHAAEHPQRDIVVGGAGKMLLTTQRLSPPFLDSILARIGYAAQHTSERRGPDAPNNLFGPVHRYNRAEGKFSNKTFPHSLSTWLDLHPTAKAAAAVGAAAGVGALLSRLTDNSGTSSPARPPAGTRERVSTPPGEYRR